MIPTATQKAQGLGINDPVSRALNTIDQAICGADPKDGQVNVEFTPELSSYVAGLVTQVCAGLGYIVTLETLKDGPRKGTWTAVINLRW